MSGAPPPPDAGDDDGRRHGASGGAPDQGPAHRHGSAHRQGPPDRHGSAHRQGPPDHGSTADPAAGAGEHPSDEAVDALLDVDLVAARHRESPDGAPPPEALTAAHVLGCARCQGVLADMRGVRDLLRAHAAAVMPPPSDLSARIAAAVAADDDRSRRRRREGARRRRSLLALAASVVVVAGLGGLAVEQGLGSGVEGASVTATGGGTEEGADATAEGDLTGAGVVVMASGTDYRPGEVAAQLDVALALADGPVPLAEGADLGPGAPTGEGPAREGAWWADCLTSIGRSGTVPVAVDTARWEGLPADVLVLPVAAGPPPTEQPVDDGTVGLRPLEVWVVQPGCSDGPDSLLHSEVLGR